MKLDTTMKNRLYLGLMILINIVIGGIVWLTVGRLIFPEINWLFCFMGYPAIFIGFFGGVLYLYNHEFA